MGRDVAARILIVDDHEDNIELLRARLEARGYTIDSAMDGEEALHAVAKSPPDLILLDVLMPRIDGFEVVRRVKANKNLPFIPIILQTALDSTEHQVPDSHPAPSLGHGRSISNEGVSTFARM